MVSVDMTGGTDGVGAYHGVVFLANVTTAELSSANFLV